MLRGELLSGFRLLIGGLLVTKKLNNYGGLITRFCGIVICGIILVQEPDSLLDVLLYDNFRVICFIVEDYSLHLEEIESI